MTLVMSVYSLRIVSERATTVVTSVPDRRDLAGVEVTDALCNQSVSVQIYTATVWIG